MVINISSFYKKEKKMKKVMISLLTLATLLANSNVQAMADYMKQYADYMKQYYELGMLQHEKLDAQKAELVQDTAELRAQEVARRGFIQQQRPLVPVQRIAETHTERIRKAAQEATKNALMQAQKLAAEQALQAAELARERNWQASLLPATIKGPDMFNTRGDRTAKQLDLLNKIIELQPTRGIIEPQPTHSWIPNYSSWVPNYPAYLPTRKSLYSQLPGYPAWMPTGESLPPMPSMPNWASKQKAREYADYFRNLALVKKFEKLAQDERARKLAAGVAGVGVAGGAAYLAYKYFTGPQPIMPKYEIKEFLETISKEPSKQELVATYTVSGVTTKITYNPRESKSSVMVHLQKGNLSEEAKSYRANVEALQKTMKELLIKVDKNLGIIKPPAPSVPASEFRMPPTSTIGDYDEQSAGLDLSSMGV